MDLTFQVPMQYCSLQHWTLLPSPVTYTTGCCFHFGSVSSFFLELFLHWSPVAYSAPTDLGSSPFSVLSFCLFILFMGFSRQEYQCGLSFSSPDYQKKNQRRPGGRQNSCIHPPLKQSHNLGKNRCQVGNVDFDSASAVMRWPITFHC